MNGLYSDRHMDSSITSGSQRVSRAGYGRDMRKLLEGPLPSGGAERVLLGYACKAALTQDEVAIKYAGHMKTTVGDVRQRARVMLGRLLAES